MSHAGRATFSWSGSGFAARFRGTALVAELLNPEPYVFLVQVDGQPAKTLVMRPGRHRYPLASALPAAVHEVRLMRQTEGQAGDTTLFGLRVEEGALLPPPPALPRALEVIGDSISCGYGDLGSSAACPFTLATESHWHSYAAVAARALSTELSTIAVSGAGLMRNLDGSTIDTLPMLYDRAVISNPSVAWSEARPPDAIVINLGTNDAAAGDPGPSFEDVYLDFLARLRLRAPHALIVLCLGPMLFDVHRPAGPTPLSDLRRYLHAVVAARARVGDDRIALLEFPKSNEADFGCDFHPNLRKHAAMAGQLTSLLRAHLGW